MPHKQIQVLHKCSIHKCFTSTEYVLGNFSGSTLSVPPHPIPTPTPPKKKRKKKKKKREEEDERWGGGGGGGGEESET